MRRARRWGAVALAGLVAACLPVAISGLARAEQDVLDWRVSGDVEAGYMWSAGERSSSLFNKYRDMDNGFLGELNLRAEKKDWDLPLFFDIQAKNPARDDQMYEGTFGWYGLFTLEGSWNQTPHVLSNGARTIYGQDGESFTLPASQRATIATTFTTGPTTAAGMAAINATINGLLRPVDLRFTTDVGTAGFKLTPTENLRFDVEYMNIHRRGNRAIGAQMAGGTGGPVNELAIPIDNFTNEVKAGIEYARPNWGLRFNYTGSIYYSNFWGFTWDNPTVATSTAAANATDRVSVAPNNSAHTFNLTGTAALPLRTRVNGTFAYTMLRQDQEFELSTQNPNLPRTNTDDAGHNSADAKANLVLGNIVLTSRPINNVTTTVRYRYFEYQNDMPKHVFTNDVYVGGGTTVGSAETKNERYTKQNAGLDLGWRPIRMLALKAGYEFEHWSRADFGDLGDTGATHPNFSNHEHIGKFAADVTPVDWFLGRLTYRYGDRKLIGYNVIPTTDLVNSVKYPYADRRENRIDALFQFSPWETVTPSVNAGYAVDNYYNNDFGLTKNEYFTAGINVDWTPVRWLTISGDYSYEQYKWDMTSRYLVGGTFPGTPVNDWRSRSKDDFHNVGLNANVDIVPKKFSVTLGYSVGFGYTTFYNSSTNQAAATSAPNATAFGWDRVFNVLQTARVVAKFRVTEKLSLRGGFAYERATEKNWATDPMQPFMGNIDSATPGGAPVAAGVQSVWLGATTPNYEAYIVSGVVRYEF